MGAIRTWVGSKWRRHRLATVVLAVVAGLTGALVAASVQAAMSAGTSLDRARVRSRVYDAVVYACPPGVDPSSIDAGAIQERCANDDVASRLRREVIAGMPEVEASSLAGTDVVGIIGAGSPNGWGQLVLMQRYQTPDAPTGLRPIVVRGRLPGKRAPDELVVGESTARAAGIQVGDRLRIGSWSQADLDAAIDGSSAPETEPFDSTVVGIVRQIDDVQGTDEGNLSGSVLPGSLYAGPAWSAAHGSMLAGYGTSTTVRLRDGVAGRESFGRALRRAAPDWYTEVDSLDPENIAPLRRIIRSEREATLIFALITGVAGLAFVGLSITRQLRRELADAPTLVALGVSRGDLAVAGILRSLTIGVPAAVLGVVATIAVSPFGPVGLARQLESAHPVRVEWWVLLPMALVVLALFGAAGALVPSAVLRPHRLPRPGLSRAGAMIRPLGPVSRVGTSFARGRQTTATVVVGAVAISAIVGAALILQSFDSVIDRPARYGAWWDVVVGQYSDPDAVAVGVATIRDNRAVTAAAGYDAQENAATIDGRRAKLVATTPYVGHPAPITIQGFAPTSSREIALGAVTARRIGKGVGDTVELAAISSPTREQLRVVGIVVINDPVNRGGGAGDGAVVTPAVMRAIFRSIPQSIAIRLDPAADRGGAIASLEREFPGSIRLARPPDDLQNLERLRNLPVLIAGLVAALAFITLGYALASILHGRRHDLAVLAAIGFTRRQRRRAGVSTGLLIVGTSVVLGVPFGMILGRQAWSVISENISIPVVTPAAGFVLALVGVVVIVAGVLALTVGAACSLVANRFSPAEQLRSE